MCTWTWGHLQQGLIQTTNVKVEHYSRRPCAMVLQRLNFLQIYMHRQQMWNRTPWHKTMCNEDETINTVAHEHEHMSTTQQKT
jgi:hypothetical protein